MTRNSTKNVLVLERAVLCDVMTSPRDPPDFKMATTPQELHGRNHTPSTKLTSREEPQPKYKANFKGGTTAQVQS